MKKEKDQTNDGYENRHAAFNEMRRMEQPPNDFRQMSVMPELEDVCMDVDPFLRPNIVKGSYPDADSYLDIQFRLLREDFYYPLRKGILDFKNPKNRKKNRPQRIDNVRFYYDVKIADYVESFRDRQNFSSKKYVLQFCVESLGKINWEGSKRLLNGSLLCLSSDNFASFSLFTIVHRDPRMLSKGQVVVSLEGADSLRADLKRKVFIIAESSVYFEAYRSILSALQKISPAHFPMKNYILGQQYVPGLPRYLQILANVSITNSYTHCRLFCFSRDLYSDSYAMSSYANELYL